MTYVYTCETIITIKITFLCNPSLWHPSSPGNPTDLFSFTVDEFAFSRISPKWNHTKYVSFCLAFCTQGNYFEIYPCLFCVCVCILFWYWAVKLYCMDIPYDLSPVDDGHSSCFQFLTIKNQSAVDMLCKSFYGYRAFDIYCQFFCCKDYTVGVLKLKKFHIRKTIDHPG